jgi:hypothetical protein
MKRGLMLAALTAAVAAAVGVSSVRAAPIPGGWHVSRTDVPNYLLTYAAGAPSSSGLTSLGCPFVQHDYGDNAVGTLTAKIKGWIGPIDQVTFLEQVDLRAHVTGTLQDVLGNTYSVNGIFREKTTIDSLASFDIVFDGTGRLRLSGPTGVVVGRAEFRFVTGPPSFELIFSSIKSCTI